MTALPEEKFITEEEYAAMEERAAVKHEYYKGRIYAMDGATGNHNDVAMNVAMSLGRRLLDSGCRPTGSDQRVKIEATGLQTYPDVSVYCKESRFEDADRRVLLDPRLVVEVLSPSTEKYDRGDKLDHYSKIPALLHILLIDPDRVRVDHWYRDEANRWLDARYSQRTETIHLNGMGIDLPVSELYIDLDVPEGVLLFPDRNLTGEDENP